MKLVVTGARGQVGRAVLAAAPREVEIVPLAHGDLDIGDEAAVKAWVASHRPDVVVNAAAYTAVDRAENEPDAARRVNSQGVANLAAALHQQGGRLLHLSTDFVFDGEKSAAYQPQDPTNPLSVYGASKLAGEAAALRLLPGRSAILRTAWVYDATGRNFLLTMLRLMRERGSVRVVADQIGTPTAAGSIARALWALISAPDVTGVHHWTDSGVASWYDFAVAIADEWSARTGGQPAVVHPISTSEYPTPARRPKFSLLNCSATIAALGIAPRHWRHNLREVIGEVSVA